MFIYIGGVPGVGKTTIITKTEKIGRKRGMRIKRIEGSSILCKLAGVDDIAKLRALPENVRRELRPEMNRQLYELDRADFETIRLADGHFVYFDVKGEDHGVRKIQPWDKKQMIGIAMIFANSKTILNRRFKDIGHRLDRKQNLNFLSQEQKMEIDIAISQAIELDISLCLIENEDLNYTTAPETLLSFCIRQAHNFKGTR